ncbi:MAG: carbon starvation protein A [Candidatus Omnitrophica bacterium]|nr:carbon starvation protein A [Candidatus Omnitrophota bacterium]
MDSVALVVVALAVFSWGYRFYAKRFEDRIGVDHKHAPPSVAKYDGIDYVPAKNWFVLFGHHFSSIAGAGPIVGPVIATLVWGWLPAAIWIIVGTVFVGGIHDFGSLLVSVREGGSSIADVASKAISPRARIMFSWFVLLALILVVSVFAYLSAKTFIDEPGIVIPSLGLIPLAMALGFAIYRLRANFVLATILGLAALCVLIYTGYNFPVTIQNNAVVIWLTALFIYVFFASILPVHILLQPRDYLSGFLLLAGLIFGYAGIFITRPNMNIPLYNTWSSGYGMLWPALFVTVACGAVSGFHSLISSGTTSKQLPNESLAKRISYGGMVVEGILAIMAVIVVASSCMRGDSGSALKQLGPIGIFGRGFGVVTAPILGKYGSFFGLAVLNAFILTTLDTATRIARYLFEELFGLKNRFLSTAVIAAAGFILALSGKWMMLWPAFGAANQLVAALALLVISGWLIARKKGFMVTFIPSVFVLLTTQFAIILQAVNNAKGREIPLFIISVVLLCLSGFVVKDFLDLIKKRRRVQHA